MFKSFMDRLGTSVRALYRLAADRLRLAVNSVTATQIAAACYVLGVVSALLVVHGAAHAQPAAESRSVPLSGGRLTIYLQPGLCKAPAQRAEYTHPDASLNVSGCWQTQQDPRTGKLMVVVMFLDAEMAVVATGDFK